MNRWFELDGSETCPRGHVLTRASSHLAADHSTMRSWVVCHACRDSDPGETWRAVFGVVPLLEAERRWSQAEAAA